MKTSKIVLASALSLALLGGTSVVANADAQGTPRVLRGTWYSMYTKVPKGSRTNQAYYNRLVVKVQKKAVRTYNWTYTKKHKLFASSPDEGINLNLTYQHTKKHQYYITGSSWKFKGDYVDYEFNLSKHNRKTVIWSSPEEASKVYYFGTFYK
ncbi:hypothetical protein [Levilactobacillus spicheri]